MVLPGVFRTISLRRSRQKRSYSGQPAVRWTARLAENSANPSSSHWSR